MAGYKLTADAERDFENIYRYSIDTFGPLQANNYAVDLIDAFEMLATNPFAGRDIKTIVSDARCFVHASHSIYYWLQDETVMIFRILHQSQDPMRHL
ncbi:type II toxin-antitoxin system RelE/ParE family toxin [Asticcacaulis sp.]|uniref:type II toxin-antitoxin system RelE/ParE family toxin n=1 Tax=Asticcacaulis sp. TaxID=1872648 RepID=UPI003F7CA71E